MKMPIDQPFPIRVFVRDQQERELAKEILEQTNSDDVQVFSNSLEGWVTREGLLRLLEHDLIVDSLESFDPVESASSPTESTVPADPADIYGETSAWRETPQNREIIDRLRHSGSEYLKSRTARQDAAPGAAPLGAPETESEEMYELTVKMPMRREWQDALGGNVISSFEPPNIFRLFLTPTERERMRALSFVLDVQPHDLGQTITKPLLDVIAQYQRSKVEMASDSAGAEDASHSSADAEPAEFEAVLHRDLKRSEVKEVIARLGGTLIAESKTVLRFTAIPEPGLLAALAANPEVKCLSPYQPPKLFSDQARILAGVDRINQGSGVLAGNRWTGAGELVAVFDSGIDDTHPDLADRIQEKVGFVMGQKTGAADDTNGHGTHVASIIVGTGKASGGVVRGMAPGAKLITVGIVHNGVLLLPPDIGDLLREATDRGAKIINLSWGGLGKTMAGTYEEGSQQLDQYIYDNPEALVVVAAGNEGSAPNGRFDFQSIRPPGTAKNALTVGACGTGRADIDRTYRDFSPENFPDPVGRMLMRDPDYPAALSSRGPTDYESVKPDLSASGVYVLAAKASQGSPGWLPLFPLYDGRYVYRGGTSMAAPVVSGLAALLREYLRVEHGLANPSAALLKAILIASAERSKPMTETEGVPKAVDFGYPDFHQGFGRVDLSRILPHPAAPPNRKLLFDDVGKDSPRALRSHAMASNNENDLRGYTLTVPPGTTEPLRIVLAWTDYPGKFVQNNLNLYVEGPTGPGAVAPGGNTIRPKFFGNSDHRFQPDALFEVLGRGGVPFDKKNNVEHIKIADPVPGQYVVKVLAQSTPYPKQGYALCVAGCVDENGL